MQDDGLSAGEHFYILLHSLYLMETDEPMPQFSMESLLAMYGPPYGISRVEGQNDQYIHLQMDGPPIVMDRVDTRKILVGYLIKDIADDMCVDVNHPDITAMLYDS